ncbi:MAG: class I SAM-dependent methyltransferase [Sideroxyarcus sp.]|nr:class I SAM-dependent methyltransferase [Sideroxyarcus sp.]
MSIDWQAFWDTKAEADSDFQATGRGLMTPTGYLYTVSEIVRLLELRSGEVLADIGCGSGLIALSLSPWLKFIHAVDFSPALVQRARSNLAGVENIDVMVGDLTDLPLGDASMDKLLAYSVLQYLGSEAAVSAAFSQVGRVLKKGGRALFAANPDPARRMVYEGLVRDRADVVSAGKELALLDDLLWIPQGRLVQLAGDVGLKAHVEPISTRIWQHFYMFDLVVEKCDV